MNFESDKCLETKQNLSTTTGPMPPDVCKFTKFFKHKIFRALF